MFPTTKASSFFLPERIEWNVSEGGEGGAEQGVKGVIEMRVLARQPRYEGEEKDDERARKD